MRHPGEGDGLGEARAWLEPLPPLPQLEAQWRDLESRSDHSFFLTWWWIGAWLEHLPPENRPRLLRVELGDSLAGLGIVCARRISRRIATSNALYLNSTGDPRYDELTIQYNGLLTQRGVEGWVLRAAVEQLLVEPHWDELYIDGFHRPDLTEVMANAGLLTDVLRRSPGYRVDLDELRATGRPYVESLSSRSRQHLRRSFREAEKLGELSFELAKTQEEGLTFLAELKALHQRSWNARGQPGSFANAFFDEFHADFVASHFAKGVVQLLRMKVGGHPVGYLYSFVHDGRVYVYQSAFDRAFCDTSSWRPGIVCHARAVELNLAAGMRVYDFMGADDRYKKDLATGGSEMVWVAFQRPRVKFRFESWGRALKRGAQALSRRRSARPTTRTEGEGG